jgi:hypothetical protein
VEPYTLNRNFHKQDVIDGFSSIIWTERYYGNSEVELIVPATSEMTKKLPEGIFLGIDGSDEIMILETSLNEDGNLKLTGISLLLWMNNRFVRTKPQHEETAWILGGGSGETAGWLLWAIIFYMCCEGSPYLNGTWPTGIANPQQLIIPKLGLKDFDKSGPNIQKSILYGPVYDAMLDIAVEYEIGMQITLESVTDTSYSLGFRSYKGLDRTSDQIINQPVRFSPQFDSLTDIKELRSIAALKTAAWAFASGIKPEDDLTTVPGVKNLSEAGDYTGFDLRALMILANDINEEMVGGSQATLVDLLNKRAAKDLGDNPFIKTVDGEIVPTSQFEYGVHYNLGDIIEVQGNSEIVQACRVTEYIRSQDEAGEKAYPTVTMLD